MGGESGGNANATSTASSATGLMQVLAWTFQNQAKLLGLDYPPPVKGQPTPPTLLAAMKNPQLNVLVGTQYLLTCEKTIQGWPEVASCPPICNDPASMTALVCASYALGPGAVRPILRSVLADDGGWNLGDFLDDYEDASAAANQSIQRGSGANQSARSAAGYAGGSSSYGGSTGSTSMVGMLPGSSDAVAAPDLTVNPNADPPTTPAMTILRGLDLAAWYSQTSPRPLVGNPGLMALPTVPAWFEVALNQQTGDRLTDGNGQPIQIRLNVSLQAFNLRSQQIVTRTPTSVGLMMTFWGSQPDTITGRGTTGLFLNQFGLSTLMSNRLTPSASGWMDLMASAGTEITSGPQNRFKVAAQDSFAELLALFKQNGVIRYLPKFALDASDQANVNSNSNPLVWSPVAGQTGFQMLARAGDVYRRGFVVLRYKGASYLGHFKSFNFTADANTPFQWAFDFTFRVSRSVSPLYSFGG